MYTTPTTLEWLSSHRIVLDYPAGIGFVWMLSAKWSWLKEWFNKFNVKQDEMVATTSDALKAADAGRQTAVVIQTEVNTLATNHLSHLQAAVDQQREEFHSFATAILEVHKDIAAGQDKMLEGQSETNKILGLLLDRSNREN